ncbi:RNA polymerase sigma factor [Pricia sp.]|uniref:RNA polymerase sigma factor n=1 Tax=Pricia sp. TaxID=2268138 RepID=UPI0035947587
MEERTDEQLMAEVANGNLDLLKILFEKHHRHVYNFLYKMSGDKMLSEDLTQDVFYQIMRYKTSYNNGTFISWLFTIARNKLKTHYRRNKDNSDNLDALRFQLAEKENPDENYIHLNKALDRLSASDREILVLNRFQEIRYKEIAEIIGSTPGAVRTAANRALKRLKVIYLKNI